jgi:hypothetical protein
METKNTMKKAVRTILGKQVYLLGKNNEDKNLYLVKASWDCGWYWGFGYVQSYSRIDLETHEHIDSGYMGEQKVWDNEKGAFVKTEYIYNIYDCPKLVETTFSENEGWQLSELFNQFYKFKEVASILHRGSAGTAALLDSLKIEYPNREEHLKEINEVILPQIFERIYTILTPCEDRKEGECE